MVQIEYVDVQHCSYCYRSRWRPQNSTDDNWSEWMKKLPSNKIPAYSEPMSEECDNPKCRKERRDFILSTHNKGG